MGAGEDMITVFDVLVCCAALFPEAGSRLEVLVDVRSDVWSPTVALKRSGLVVLPTLAASASFGRSMPVASSMSVAARFKCCFRNLFLAFLAFVVALPCPGGTSVCSDAGWSICLGITVTTRFLREDLTR